MSSFLQTVTELEKIADWAGYTLNHVVFGGNSFFYNFFFQPHVIILLLHRYHGKNMQDRPKLHSNTQHHVQKFYF